MKQLSCCFLLSICSLFTVTAQTVSWEFLAPVPEPVTNQAVVAAQVDGKQYVYSFAGMDSTLTCNGDHLRAYRYDFELDSWETLDNIPDPQGGKIAPAASLVGGRIYIIGGYHLASNCSETSSSRTHIFDPQTNAFLADGANIPLAIDDQVQAVWRDSLIFVVTGWSNTGNVPNVQIYNPGTDEWMSGTAVTNNSTWKVFGGSGVIIGDTIYYAGGAKSTGFFGPTSHFRKGYIHPDDPTQIDWIGSNDPLAKGYRMGATSFAGEPIWIGGSDDTYNFDALAYSGGNVVPPLDRITIYRPATGQLEQLFGLIPPIMDMRGVAELGNGEYIIVGGMLDDQEVTNQVLKITISDLTDSDHIFGSNSWRIYPNPTSSLLTIRASETQSEHYQVALLSTDGQLIRSGQLRSGEQEWSTNLENVPSGIYWLQLLDEKGNGSVTRIVVQ